MFDNVLVRLTFACGTEEYSEPNHVVEEIYIKNSEFVGIPRPSEGLRQAGFKQTDLVKVEVFKKL